MSKISGLIQALRQVPTSYYLALVLGVGTIGAYQYWAHEQQERGALRLRIAQHEQTNADLRDSLATANKQYKVDTIWRRVTQTRVDTMATTVDRWKHDTLRVVEFVARADTAAKACTAALQTCEERVRIAQLGWKNARDEINRIKALPKQGWIARHTAASVGVGATYGQDGKVAVGPTVSFGFRFFP